MIPTQLENPKGLHQRYHIEKVVVGKLKYELIPVDEGAEYFVLRLDTGGSDINHIKACRIAVRAYAEAMKDYLPGLTEDLNERYPLL